MKVSILTITYNHENFIAKALDSVLMQTVNFDYEIVIGEDCSTDGTRDIVLAYRDKHPDKIRLLLPDKNLGMHRNFVETYRACRGEYVALLEGDDYWSRPYKLQKQADFLDANLRCSICFHPVDIVKSDDPLPFSVFPAGFSRAISTLEDLVQENFIPNCSTVFRRGLFHDFPEWFFSLGQGDWPLHVLNAQHGDIGFLDERMAVYRVHQGGVWSGTKVTRRLEAIISAYRTINHHLDYRFDRLIQLRIARCYYDLSVCRERLGEVEEAKGNLRKSLRAFFSTVPARDHAKLALKLYSPFWYRILVGRSIERVGNGRGATNG